MFGIKWSLRFKQKLINRQSYDEKAKWFVTFCEKCIYMCVCVCVCVCFWGDSALGKLVEWKFI